MSESIDAARALAAADNDARAHLAFETLGFTASVLLWIATNHAGALSAEALAFETAAADADDVHEAIERLVDARLAQRTRSGGLQLLVDPDLGASAHTLADGILTGKELTAICQNLGVTPDANRAAERIRAISETFGDQKAGARILGRLSGMARQIFDAIADAVGLGELAAGTFGLSFHDLSWLEPVADRANQAHVYVAPEHSKVAFGALAELVDHGLVGSDSFGNVWIWREAWQLADRPLFDDWMSVPRPEIVACAAAGSASLSPTAHGAGGGAGGDGDEALLVEQARRALRLVVRFEELLRYWGANPTKALKTRERRFPKPSVKATAKAFQLSDSEVELLVGLAMSMRFLLENDIAQGAKSRRGPVDLRWMIDPDVMDSWLEQPPMTKWSALLAYHTKAGSDWRIEATRFLMLWHLSTLAPGGGVADETGYLAWLGIRYSPLVTAEAAAEVLHDLRALEVVTRSGPVGLTALGRLALTDFEGLERIEVASSDQAIVQADLTVVTPPDLDPRLLARLAGVAKLESDAGALIFRLDESAIAESIHAGETVDTITAFLETLSSVPIEAAVSRFVSDAASAAEKLSIIDAPSVLVGADPAELAAAASLKPAKLTIVAPTVAISPLSPEKLRSVLAKKGLAPALVRDGESAPEPRRSSEQAKELEAQAEEYEKLSKRWHDRPAFKRQAERLLADAERARNPGRRWTTYQRFGLPAPPLPGEVIDLNAGPATVDTGQRS